MGLVQKSPEIGLLVEEFCDFLIQAGKAGATIRNRREDINALISWFESRRGTSFDTEEFVATGIEDYREWLRSRFKVATANRRLTSLNVFLKWVSARTLVRLPEYRVARYTPQSNDLPSPHRTLDEAEQTQLIESIESSGDLKALVIIRLMLDCGLRASEICTLGWDDVTLAKNDGTLSIRSHKSPTPKKLPLPDKTREALASLRQSQVSRPTCHVLNGQAGSISQRSVEMLVTRYSTMARLPDVTPKTLRRSYVMNIFASRMDSGALASLPGDQRTQLMREYISLQLNASPLEYKL